MGKACACATGSSKQLILGGHPRWGIWAPTGREKRGARKAKGTSNPHERGQRSKSQMHAATAGRAGQPRECRQTKAGHAGWGLTLKSAGRTTGKASSETQDGNPGPSQQGDRAGQCEGMKSHKEEQRESWSWAERDSGTSRERSLEREERWLACVRGG